LFESLWERSEPLDAYIAEHHSDVL